MPKLSFVVAYSKNRGIGKDNQMPWHLPNDFKHFKNITLNHTVLMGRKTYESIGRPLPNREMIVLTRQKDFQSDYARVIHSVDALIPLTKDLYVIGGAEIYNMLLPKADVIYATEVDTTIAADAFFPELPSQEWQAVSHDAHPADARHAFPYLFIEYHRV